MPISDHELSILKKRCVDAMGTNANIANHQSTILQLIHEIEASRAWHKAKKDLPTPEEIKDLQSLVVPALADPETSVRIKLGTTTPSPSTLMVFDRLTAVGGLSSASTGSKSTESEPSELEDSSDEVTDEESSSPVWDDEVPAASAKKKATAKKKAAAK